MTTPTIATNYGIYEFDAVTLDSIQVATNYHKHTIVIQPVNLPVDVDLDSDLTELVNNTTAVPKAGLTGVVTLTISPPHGVDKYPLSDGAINLSNPNFITSTTPIGKVHMEITTAITGCTHFAVIVTSYP